MADATQKNTKETTPDVSKEMAEKHPEVVERGLILGTLWKQEEQALSLQKDLRSRYEQILNISGTRIKEDKDNVLKEIEALTKDIKKFIDRMPKEVKKKGSEKERTKKKETGERLERTSLPDGRTISVGEKVTYTSKRGNIRDYKVIAIGRDADGVVRFQLQGKKGPSFPVSVASFMDRGEILAPEVPPRPSESKRNRTKASVEKSEIREAPKNAQDALVGRSYQFVDRNGNKRVARIQQKDIKKKRLFVYLPDIKEDVIITFEDWPNLSREKKRAQSKKKKDKIQSSPKKSGEMILHPDSEKKRLPARSGGDMVHTPNMPVEQDTVRVLDNYPRLPPPPKQEGEIALSDADIEEVVEPAVEAPPIPTEQKQEQKEADPELIRLVRAIEDAAKSGQAFQLGAITEPVRIERVVPTPYREDKLDSLTLSTGVTFRDPAEDILRRLGRAIVEQPITELTDADIEEVTEPASKPPEQKETAPRRALDVLSDPANWRETKTGEKEPIIAWPVRLVAERMDISEENAFRELMALSRDGKIKELRFDENTHPILIEVVGAEASAEQKETAGTYSFSPRELSGMLGAETMSRVLGRMTDVFTSDTGSFEQMKAEMDTLFDNLSERQQQVLEQRLKENGKTVDDFVKEWKNGLSERVTEGLQYHMLASLERDAYVAGELRMAEERAKAGTDTAEGGNLWQRFKKNIGSIKESLQRNIKPILISAVAAGGVGAATIATGGAVFVGTVFAGAMGTGVFRFAERKDKTLQKEREAVQKKVEAQRKEAVKGAQERLKERFEKNGETIFAEYVSNILKESKEVDQANIHVEVLNALRKETEDTDATMEYVLAALRKRNPITGNSAFSEKAAKLTGVQNGVREFLSMAFSGQIKELWRYDESKWKRRVSDGVNTIIGGVTGMSIGMTGGLAERIGARGGLGFTKGFSRTLGKETREAKEAAYESEMVFAENTLAESESLMKDLFEKKSASAEDLAGLVEQTHTLESLLANDELMDRAPDLKPRIESAIEEIKTTGALLNVLDAVRIRTEGMNDHVRELMEKRMKAAKKENAPGKWKAIVQGIKEGSIVAGIGGALDLARGVAGDVKDFLEDFFATEDRGGVRRIVIPYDEPVRPGVVPADSDAAAPVAEGRGAEVSEGTPEATAEQEASASETAPPAETGPKKIGETHTLQDLDKSSLLGAQKAMWEKYGSDDLLKAVAERRPGWAKFDDQGNITNPDRVFQRWSVEQAKANGQWFDKKAQYFDTRVYKSTEVSLVLDKDGYPTVKLDKYGEFETQKVVARAPRAPEPETAGRPSAPGEEKMSAYDEQLAKDREAHRRIMEDQGGRLTFKDHQELWGEKDTGATPADSKYSAEEIAASKDRARFAAAQRDYFAEAGEQSEAVERSLDARTNEVVNHPETQGHIYTRATNSILGTGESDRVLHDFTRQYVETHPSFNPTDPKDMETFKNAWRLEAQNAIIEHERSQEPPAPTPVQSTPETSAEKMTTIASKEEGVGEKETETPSKEVSSSESVTEAVEPLAPPATAEKPVQIGKAEKGMVHMSVWNEGVKKPTLLDVPESYRPTPGEKASEITLTIEGEPTTGRIELRSTPTGGLRPVLVADIGGGEEVIDMEKATVRNE